MQNEQQGRHTRNRYDTQQDPYNQQDQFGNRGMQDQYGEQTDQYGDVPGQYGDQPQQAGTLSGQDPVGNLSQQDQYGEQTDQYGDQAQQDLYGKQGSDLLIDPATGRPYRTQKQGDQQYGDQPGSTVNEYGNEGGADRPANDRDHYGTRGSQDQYGNQQ